MDEHDEQAPARKGFNDPPLRTPNASGTSAAPSASRGTRRFVLRCEDCGGIPLWGDGFSGGRAEDFHAQLGLSWPLLQSLAAWADHWDDNWTRTSPVAWVNEGRRLADWVRAELGETYVVEYWRELVGPNLYVQMTPDSASPLWDEASPIGELGMLRHRLELSEPLVHDLYAWAATVKVNDLNAAASVRTIYAPETLRARVQAELGVTFHVHGPD